jgi:hypothetical protein
MGSGAGPMFGRSDRSRGLKSVGIDDEKLVMGRVSSAKEVEA